MSKSKKIILRIIPIVMVVILFAGGSLFADGIATGWPSGGTAAPGITTTTNNIWATIRTVVNVLAIAAIVIAGVRYMFASADSKADIKQQTIILVVGAVLVFAASNIAGLIANASNTIIQK